MSDFANKTICSWDDFYKTILEQNSLEQNSRDRQWIYRGQTKHWPLTTKIELTLNNWEIDLKDATSIEFQTIREFRRRMREPQHHRVHNDTLFFSRAHATPWRTHSTFGLRLLSICGCCIRNGEWIRLQQGAARDLVLSGKLV